VRALGSAIRAFHTLEARDASLAEIQRARVAVDSALTEVIAGGADPLVRLRAVQLDAFVAELRRFEATGDESDELRALAGAFVRRMRLEGWCKDHVLAMNETVRRVLFKQMFDAFIGLEGNKDLEPSLDEQRALYAFFLSHAHPGVAARDALAAARRGATEPKQCEAIAEGERVATEAWRLERVRRLAAIDPTYPAAYARGIVEYRRGSYGAAAESFRQWLEAHPNGPWALRAQSYWRAAVDKERESF
jgi:hypothetical protein